MAGLTKRFHLTTFDATTDDISQDDWKYGVADRRFMDRLLTTAMEAHRHDGVTHSADEPPAPTAAVVLTGGFLPPGSTIYYKYGLVDEKGHEQLSSRPLVVRTPQQVGIPRPPRATVGSAPGLSEDNPSGPTQYVVSAYVGTSAQETQASRPVEVVSRPGGSVLLTMPPVPSGATGFNVYRKGPVDERFYLLTSFTVATTSYVDDLSWPLATRAPSVTNKTNSTTSIEVGLPPTVTPPAHWSWRLYRTTDPSDWAYTLIDWVWQGTSSVDRGAAPREGSPSQLNTVVNSPEKILLTDAAEVQGTLPPGVNVFQHELVLREDGPVAEGPFRWYWVSEFDHAEVARVRGNLIRGSTPSVRDVIATLEVRRAGEGTWTEILAHETANRPYLFGAEEVANGDLDLEAVPLKLAYVTDDYVFHQDDVHLTDIPDEAKVGFAQVGFAEIIDNVLFASPRATIVPEGYTITAMVLYHWTGDPATSELLAYITRPYGGGPPISIVTNNGYVTPSFPEGIYILQESS